MKKGKRRAKRNDKGLYLAVGLLLIALACAVFIIYSRRGAGEGAPVFSGRGSVRELSRLEDIQIQNAVQKADRLAMGYEYDEAVRVIEQYPDYLREKRLTMAKERYEEAKSRLKPYDGPISHVFFHSLIADTEKAFDGDAMSNGYNYWMTTVSEFNKILEQMYGNGYVLVRLHDVAGPVRRDGKTVYEKKEIWLPEGKKPFVLSQDDVAYYDYMKEDGFARRLVIDSEGRIACQMEADGGLVTKRDFDVVPLLDRFVEEHPDFSYRGARGILALTGYEGALGYRVSDMQSKTWEQDKKELKKLAKALRADGWEFASHGYGHLHMQKITLDKLKQDTDRWEREIESLVGKTDIYIYPYGEEISYDGGKLSYLKKKGFRYFCGVYAYPYLNVQPDYVRMTRRNLDGFTMHFYPDRVTDLFDLETVYDTRRPKFY